jgi:hypothetical protein
MGDSWKTFLFSLLNIVQKAANFKWKNGNYIDKTPNH